MGLFSRGRNANQGTRTEEKQNPSSFDKAMDYFDDQQIRCESLADQKAIEKLYKALKEDNYDTTDDDNLVGAISSRDANIYNLCKAIINQNFMLMRKVDMLAAKVERLENKQ